MTMLFSKPDVVVVAVPLGAQRNLPLEKLSKMQVNIPDYQACVCSE
jgi:hypothetical protein